MLEVLVTPPGLFLVVGLVAWGVSRRRPRLARGLLIADGLALLGLSLPLVAGAWLATFENEPPLDLKAPGAWEGAGAIVVLGADVDAFAPEVGGHRPGRLTLERLHQAARVARATGLPLLVSGGRVHRDAPPAARLMAQTLQGELGVAVTWIEDRSRTTLENAEQSARLLQAAGIGQVLLVTHAWHVPRARRCLEAQGLQVIAAATGYHADPPSWPGSLRPSLSALRESGWAFHEWWGGLWYALRHGV